ncbi:MAG: dephospho-CoA kinase [Methylotenera sp.]|nr:dephospho-CoA kinase [Oligoflexia bacterium]
MTSASASSSPSLAAKMVGLTGGIASGKSTVARIFAELGIPVLDADQIARKLREPGGAAHPLIVKRFGTADPAQLREIIFRDASSKSDLEKLLHPLIVQASETAAQAALSEKPNAPFLIYEAALLVETGRSNNLAALIVVDSATELRKNRLIARDGILAELAEKMILGQTSDDLRRQAATCLITNNGTPAELRSQVRELIEKLTLLVSKT